MGKERRVFTRTSGHVSKYPSPCTKKGDGIIDYFKTHMCPVREGESVKSQCVYVYTKVFAFHFTFVRLFYLETPLTRFFARKKTISARFEFPIPGDVY